MDDIFLKQSELCPGSMIKKDKGAHKYENDTLRFIQKDYLTGESGKKFVKSLISMLKSKLKKYFSQSYVGIYYKDSYIGSFWSNMEYASSIPTLYDDYDGYIRNMVMGTFRKGLSIYNTAVSLIHSRIPASREITENKLLEALKPCINKHREEIISILEEYFSFSYAIELMNTKNEHYMGKLDKYINYHETILSIKDGILQTIPENYIDLYPLARKMKRKFVLHIGGTNSGKTYTALQAMKKHGSGVYLGPLRLLAADQFEKLNQEGFICSMKTGEEQKYIPEASFLSSTIEMLNFSQHYSCAVIDEAQMIADDSRGGAWTNAIIGILADEIHICSSPDALGVLKKIISSCGDDYTIKYHKRQTPLIMETEKFCMNKEGVKKGDAFIVFSKRKVHEVANHLKNNLNIKTSIIYGALPYDVRQNEADKFSKGITDVVVTTDAIGLGMNLPIRRVIFLENTKYDGKQRRSLYPQEIRQIAGRAGRYGIFEEGYVNAYEDKGFINHGIFSDIPDISCAYLRFPENLVHIPGDLSDILKQWKKMSVNDGFQKSDIQHELNLCRVAETYTDDKKLIYDFITIPFDEENRRLYELWLEMLDAKLHNIHLNLHDISPLSFRDVSQMKLHELENAYKVCDMIYYYNEKFENSVESLRVMKEKDKISKAIIKWLDEHELPKRRCSICGESLLWNSKYSICEKCHRKNFRYPYC